ncbi:MAG: ATP-binding protein [Candidatus Magasanikbacteria bacterium]
MVENGKGDRRDLVRKSQVEVLEEYDNKMQGIFEHMRRMCSDNGQREEIASKLLVEVSNILETPAFEDIIQPEMVKYFEHDALNFRNSVVGFLKLVQSDLLQNREDGSQISGLEQQLDFLQSNWEYYRLVLEDLLLRIPSTNGIEAKKIIERDKKQPIADFLKILDKYISEKAVIGGRTLEKEINLDEEKIKKLRVAIPFGVLFNFLHNCVSNATFAKVKAENFKFSILEAGEELVFEFWDDGIGIDEDVKGKIYDEGFTTKDGNGLGLANAAERMTRFGSSVSVESSPNPNPGKGEWATKFILKIPIIKE